MTEYLPLEPDKAQFIQKLDKDNFHDRVEMCKTLIPMLEDNDTQESSMKSLSICMS